MAKIILFDPKALSLNKSVKKNTMAPLKVNATIKQLKLKLIISVGDFFMIYLR